MKKYNLELNERQVILVKDALEEYFRIRMNQWSELANDLSAKNKNLAPEHPHHNMFFEKFISDRDAIEEVFNAVGRILGWQYNNSKSEEQLIAEDIWQVIRHELWKERDIDNEWCVDSRTPLKMSEEPLPTMTKVED